MPKVQCPNCERFYDVDSSIVGVSVTCQACDYSFIAIAADDKPETPPTPTPTQPPAFTAAALQAPKHSSPKEQPRAKQPEMEIPDAPGICMVFDIFAVFLFLLTAGGCIGAFEMLGAKGNSSLAVCTAVYIGVTGGTLFFVVGGISAIIAYLHKILVVLHSGVYHEIYKE